MSHEELRATRERLKAQLVALLKDSSEETNNPAVRQLLEELQALPDDAGEIQRDGVTRVGMGGEVRAQRFAGQRNHFGFELRRRGEREAVGRDQGRPSDGLSGRAFFDQDVLFAAAHLHGKGEAEAATGDQVNAVGGIAQVEQFRAGGQQHAFAERQHAFGFGGRQSF